MRALAFLIFLLFPASASAQSPAGVSWGGELDFNSRYAWQGIAYSKGPVLQPSLWIADRGFTFSAWGSQRLGNEPQRWQLTEVTFGLGYSRVWKGWKIEPGYENWVNRGTGDDSGPNTAVAEVRVSRDAGPFSLFTNQMFDVQSYAGAYRADAGISWEKRIRRLRLTSSVVTGWASAKFNENYFGPAKSAWNHTGFEVTATVITGKHTYVRPHFQYTALLDRDLRASVATPNLWTAGIAAGFSF